MGGPVIPTVGPHRTARHLYYFDGQGPWPGVTSIIGILDKPALVRWQREQVARAALRYADRLVADRDTDAEAAVAFLLAARDDGDFGRERGTRVHDALEAHLRGEPYTIEDGDEPFVDGALAWMASAGVRPIEVEALLLNTTAGYGGTCDLIAVIDGETWLLDWKTSRTVAGADGRVYAEMRLQLAAYADAEFIARSGSSERHPLPPIDRFGIVHVTDGGTRLYPVDLTPGDRSAFRACLELYRWRK